ncbi:hypothetical protein [Arthrobacter sp. L77]|uniref:hypothetical protein n=1 Tax=Arthrobacter sp. L77 TaxID=1496689 RepID=UPI0005B9627D|nr:hypothetical protein [Arthrobacter sp. L77]
MTRRTALPPSISGVSFALVAASDVPRSRTRCADLMTPSRGIRHPRAGGEGYADFCRPYLLVTGDSCLSHTSAARLHGIPLPLELEQDQRVHLARPRGAASPRRRGVVGRRLSIDDDEIVGVEGLRVTSPARTWLDLAAIVDPVHLVVAGDYLVSLHRRSFGAWTDPLVPIDELRTYIEGHGRVRGLAPARRALTRLRVGVDSPPETLLRLMLDDAGLPAFEVDCPILGPDGVAALWPDLTNEQYRVAIEYDGAHHLTPEQQMRDIYRDALTAELGWVQVKVNRLDLKQGQWWVAAKVGRVLRRHGWRP